MRVAPLDLSKYDDMATYVRAHDLAYRSLAAAHGKSLPLISQRLERARADLSALQCRPSPAPLVEMTAIPDTCGINYVILGAHLGSKLLSRQWATTTDQRVRGAHHLLQDDTLHAQWREFVARTDQSRATGSFADEAVAAAQETFRLFQTAFETIMTDNVMELT